MGNATKFHPHTGALIEPLWIRPDGRAMWPILGASPDDPPPADPPPSDPPAPTPPSDPPPADPPADPDDKLGEGGKKALQAERDARKALEKQVNDLTAAQQAQMDAIAKALGLKTDDPPDAEKLAAQVAEEQGRARDAQIQLAIYRNSGTEANADLLVDSQKFRAATKDVDPTDADAMTAAIKAFVEQNPAFKAAPGTPPTPPFPGGPRTPVPSGAGSMGEAIANKIAAQRR